MSDFWDLLERIFSQSYPDFVVAYHRGQEEVIDFTAGSRARSDRQTRGHVPVLIMRLEGGVYSFSGEVVHRSADLLNTALEVRP